MTNNHRQLPVMDVDQAFPLLTTDAAARRTPSSDGDQGPTVTAAIRDVLGWRPRPQDTKAFAAALGAAFDLKSVEGHVEATFVPRGFAVQADMGGITGGQASLYSRAQSAHEQITRMLDGLQPLRPDADPEDCAAFRTLVRDAVRQVVQELGMPGGPRVQLVDSAFRTLTGVEPPPPVPATPPDKGVERSSPRTVGNDGDDTDMPLVAATPGKPGGTADTVPGILGALRDRMGLTDDNVNTVDEEKIRTSFLTLVDLVIDLQRSWQAQRTAFGSDAGRGFLGTELILINRLLAAAAEQVDELEAVLDSTLISAAERQTIVLDPATRLTLDGLLTWLRVFLTEDGPRTVRDTGRDGITTSFTPTVLTLLEAVRTTLVAKLPVTDNALRGAVSLLPIGCCSRLPSGMYAARTRIAISGLCSLMEQLARNSARIGRFAGVVLFDVVASAVAEGTHVRPRFVRIEVRGLHLRPGYIPAFVREPGPGRSLEQLVLPVAGSTSSDTDSMVGVFRLRDAEAFETIVGTGLIRERLLPGQSFAVPASAVPLAVVDGESGRVVLAPVVRTWPTLAPAAGGTSFDLPKDLDDESQAFVGGFDAPPDPAGDPDCDCEEPEPFGAPAPVATSERSLLSRPAVASANGSSPTGNGSGTGRAKSPKRRLQDHVKRRADAAKAVEAERRDAASIRLQRAKLAEQIRALTADLQLTDGLLADSTSAEVQARARLQTAEADAARAEEEVRAADLRQKIRRRESSKQGKRTKKSAAGGRGSKRS